MEQKGLPLQAPCFNTALQATYGSIRPPIHAPMHPCMAGGRHPPSDRRKALLDLRPRDVVHLARALPRHLHRQAAVEVLPQHLQAGRPGRPLRRSTAISYTVLHMYRTAIHGHLACTSHVRLHACQVALACALSWTCALAGRVSERAGGRCQRAPAVHVKPSCTWSRRVYFTSEGSLLPPAPPPTHPRSVWHACMHPRSGRQGRRSYKHRRRQRAMCTGGGGAVQHANGTKGTAPAA